MPQQRNAAARHDRLLPWIAAERGFRAVVLLAVGITLVTHPHTNWASEISNLAQRLGLDPRENWIQRIMNDVGRLHANQDLFFGGVAIAYGVLEGAESYGLFRRRRWGEWLTVVATSLLFIPEVWELTKSATALKVGVLLVNVLVVAYLLWRLRRPEVVHSSTLTPLQRAK
ncbi:MAG TPA: DUF2127 domain-containing protein [Solirubrobacteraceae bacterium]|jgi:uncharacterized membrane protein (DUF2068 family)|nr:DUF2127 domain-containing protein [Solirubrobacteraceae bacterium]